MFPHCIEVPIHLYHFSVKTFTKYCSKLDFKIIEYLIAAGNDPFLIPELGRSAFMSMAGSKDFIGLEKINLDVKSETKKAPIIKGLYLGQSIQDAKDALAKIGIESEIQFSENMKLAEIRSDLIENYLLESSVTCQIYTSI